MTLTEGIVKRRLAVIVIDNSSMGRSQWSIIVQNKIDLIFVLKDVRFCKESWQQ